MSCPRVSYRRRMHYATRGNRVRMIRTPGNKLIMQRVHKRSQGVHTPWVLGHKRLAGTKALRHTDARLQPRHEKTVSRAYGGVLSHDQVRDRIVRAFLVEEQRVMRAALAARAKYLKSKRRTAAKAKAKEEKRGAIAKRVQGKALTKKAPAKKATPGRVPVGASAAKK